MFILQVQKSCQKLAAGRKRGMMKNKTTIREQATMFELSELSIKYDRALKYIKILNECLDLKEHLNELYRQENDELKNKIRILENDR